MARLAALGGWRFYTPSELDDPLGLPTLRAVQALVLPWTEDVADAALARLPDLQLVAALGTGVWDYLDVTALSQRGVAVANTPDYAADAVAEHALALLLAVARGLPAADRAVRAGTWQAGLEPGRELRALTLGVVGLGSVGGRFAEIAASLGMRVVAHTAHPSRHARAGLPLLDLPSLLAEADVVSLHVPWRGGPPLLGRAELALMRPGSILINTARGRLVDEEALIEALETGRLSGAGLDVFTHEPLAAENRLTTLANVVLTPHRAADTELALRRAADMAIDNVVAFFEGSPRNLVNLDALGPASGRATRGRCAGGGRRQRREQPREWSGSGPPSESER